MKPDTTSREFFDEKYRRNPDPWQFASSEYEQSRYDATVKALGHCRYVRAFEPGCSIGVLTARLAAICSRVDATDISPAAVQQARQTCRTLPNVVITAGTLPKDIPDGTFDLIVFSEIGYYFPEEKLLPLANELSLRLRTPGTLLATHWLGASEDHILSGDRVHEILGVLPALVHTHSERTTGFRLDRWDRT